MIEPKAVAGELTRKHYGPDTPAQAKNLKSGNGAAPSIKSFIEVDGQLLDEDELAATLKATSQALAAARQILTGGA